jgi:hypothetical protein
MARRRRGSPRSRNVTGVGAAAEVPSDSRVVVIVRDGPPDDAIAVLSGIAVFQR